MREKKVLILAYYFPPFGMGGVQRVAKFAKYLPRFGWKPYVLTVKEAEYWAKDHSLVEELPPEVRVFRTGSFDPLRISYILRRLLRRRKREEEFARGSTLRRSKLSSWLFFPDSKVGWMPFALVRTLRLCRKEKFDLIFSSSPPPSLHLTGYLLKLATGIPWIADFRDSWIGYKLEAFPTPFHLFLKVRVQRSIINAADRVIVANPAIKGEFEMRHPPAENICLVNQGYDEEDFKTYKPSTSEIFSIGYLGTFSPDCDPEPFLSALGEWIDQRKIPKNKVKLIHIGLSTGIDMDGLIEKHALKDVVIRKGYLSHKQALEEMKGVSFLLLVTSDHPSVFPAKIFEYLRLKKPILSIVPSNSQIAKTLAEMKVGKVVSPEHKEEIKEKLDSYFSDFQKDGLSSAVSEGKLAKFERKALTLKLASLFDEVTRRGC
ncbi:MAG: glycosyltransferase [Candidatus Zixiibacteriota bacterium]